MAYVSPLAAHDAAVDIALAEHLTRCAEADTLDGPGKLAAIDASFEVYERDVAAAQAVYDCAWRYHAGGDLGRPHRVRASSRSARRPGLPQRGRRDGSRRDDGGGRVTPGFIPTPVGRNEDCGAARRRLSADLDRLYLMREAALRRARACAFPGIGPETRPDIPDDGEDWLSAFMAIEIASEAHRRAPPLAA